MTRFAATLLILAALVAAPVFAQDAPAPPPTPQPFPAPQPFPSPAPQAETPTPQEPNSEEETPRPRRFGFGPEIGFYIPTSDRTRAAFGSTWVNYGLGFRPIGLASKKGLLGFDLNIISTRGSGRRAFLAPVSLIYKRAIGGGNRPGEGVTPYIGAAAGVLIADLRSDNFGVSSGFRSGFGGSAILGITYQTRAYVEARYQLYSKIKGYDLSGLNIATGIRF